MEALLTIVPFQRALFDWRRHHADAGYASLTLSLIYTMKLARRASSMFALRLLDVCSISARCLFDVFLTFA